MINSNKILKNMLVLCLVVLSVVSLLITFSFNLSSTSKVVQAATLNTFTLGNAKQTIKGFGVSSVEYEYARNNQGYVRITPDQRAELDRPLLDDIKINTMRYWGDISDFVRNYGIQYNNIKSQVTNHLYQANIKDSNMNTEPARIAQGVKDLKDNNNIVITHVSVCNECEPSLIALNNWPVHVINLRNALDDKGLQSVKVVATEGPNNDDSWLDKLKAIRNNPTAWAALGVISSHSYSMALRPEDEAFKTGSGKEWWIGESSNNGPESLGNASVAGESIARVLHDFNSGADNWIWFIGHAIADAGDDRTRLIRYWESPFRSEKLEKFYYFKQFRDIFQDGTRIYDTVSNLEGKMPWTYQNYANMQATGGKNTDGSWSLGVVNFSGQSQAAKFKINELVDQPPLTFDIFRSNGTDRGTKIGTVASINGEITIPQDIQSKEFITLKSTNSQPPTSSTSFSTTTSTTSSVLTTSLIQTSTTTSTTSSDTSTTSSFSSSSYSDDCII